MDAMQNPHLQGIAKFLVQKNLLLKEKVVVYQQVASDNQLSLLQYLVNNRIICPKIIASAVANHFCLAEDLCRTPPDLHVLFAEVTG